MEQGEEKREGYRGLGNWDVWPDRYYLKRKQHREKQEKVENEVGPDPTMRRKRKVEGNDVKWGLGYLLPAAR